MPSEMKIFRRHFFYKTLYSLNSWLSFDRLIFYAKYIEYKTTEKPKIRIIIAIVKFILNIFK